MWLCLNEKGWTMISDLGWAIIAWFRSVCIRGRFFTMEYGIASLHYPWCWPTSTYRSNISQTKMNNHVRVEGMLCLCFTYIVYIMLVACLRTSKYLSVGEFDNYIIYRIFRFDSLSILCYLSLVCSVMLVVCVCFKYFIGRNQYTRKRDENDQNKRRNEENALVATSMAFAMTWKSCGATYLEGNTKKMGTEVDDVHHQGHDVRHDPPTSHVQHFTLMAFAMRSWRPPWASGAKK